jgi:hypothetical protein
VGDWLKYADIQKVKSEQIRLANPEGKNVQVDIDVTSVRDKLLAKARLIASENFPSMNCANDSQHSASQPTCP